MAVWVVRAGSKGRREEAVLQSNFTAIGWNTLPDLSQVHDRDTLRAVYHKACPTETDQQVAGHVGQVWAFLREIKPGDLVLLPRLLKGRREEVAIAKVTGTYRYRSDLDEELHHTLPVQWLCKSALRTSFDQEIQQSFGVPLTVYQPGCDKAEERIQAVLTGQPVTGSGSAAPPIALTPPVKKPGTELSRVLEDVRQKIARYREEGKNPNEENTKQKLINPVLRVLGWDPAGEDVVMEDRGKEGKYNPADYILLVNARPKVLVEAKHLSDKLDDYKYANELMANAGTAAAGAEWLVLTNGNHYYIYNATVQVSSFGERLFRKVHLSDPNAEETLALLSKEKIGGLHAIWQDDLNDRRVDATIKQFGATDLHRLVVQFVADKSGLDQDKVEKSLPRICRLCGTPCPRVAASVS